MKLKLIEKRDEAKGTKSFFWETESPVSYLPGQYYYYTLPTLKYPDPRGNTRHFTLSSSPTEGASAGKQGSVLRLTTRIREESGFKKTMDELPIGTEIQGEGPSGVFVLTENIPQPGGEPGPHVFLAGGIGITPFRSIAKYAIDKDLGTRIHFIYSNSLPEEIIFRTELEGWASSYPNIKVDLTITKPQESQESWSGLTGRIDSDLINTLVTDLQNSIFWVCGPPPMVDAVEQELGKMAIPMDHVRSEKFTGY